MDVSEVAFHAVVDATGSAAAVSRALAALSDTDLLRLQALARLRARALPPGVGWEDLLHEALARALDGSRQWPPGLPLLAFLAGVMRSVCNELWRRRRQEAELIIFDQDAGIDATEPVCPAADQERIVAAGEAIAALYRLFSGDNLAMRILAGLGQGLSAEEIRTLHGLSSVDYDSTRRRMRRALLRAGLCWSEP
jgi:RNA polymerase sigma-70 factor (ECF subfamily)